VNWLAAEGRAARKLVLVRDAGRGAEAGAGAWVVYERVRWAW